MREVQTLTPEALLERLHQAFLQGESLDILVTGHSMRPFLRHLRDGVVLVSPEQYPPRSGDVVLFQRESGKLVLHRIRKLGKEGFFTVSGDSQLWTEQVRPEQILAVVSALCRGKRTIPCRDWKYRLLVRGWYRIPGLRWAVIRLDGGLWSLKQKWKNQKVGKP